MTVAVTITVDADKVIAVLQAVTNGIDDLVREVADELALNAASEAGKRSTRLGQPWKVTGESPTQAHVEAPEWWAHFLAGGTAAHGPSSAAHLVFSVAGTTVFANFVSGIAADHFDERAVEQTRGRVDDIMRGIIARAA